MATFTERVEELKREYTDKYVVVDASRPELARFRGLTGMIKTVNMSGRALVEFDGYNNIGWYDIELLGGAQKLALGRNQFFMRQSLIEQHFVGHDCLALDGVDQHHLAADRRCHIDLRAPRPLDDHAWNRNRPLESLQYDFRCLQIDVLLSLKAEFDRVLFLVAFVIVLIIRMIVIMTMVIVGGMDNTLGVIFGAFLLTLLPEKLRFFADYRLLFVSVVVILFLLLRPQGLFPQRARSYGGH